MAEAELHGHHDVAATVDEGGDRLGLRDLERSVGSLGDAQPHHHPVLAAYPAARARRAHAGQEVPQSEHHPPSVDLLDRLDHVGVVTDDHVDGAAGGDRFRHLPLGGADRAGTLVAPVQRDDHEAGPGGARLLGLGHDAGRVDQVRPPWPVARERPAVEPERVGQVGNGRAADVEQARTGLRRRAGHPGVTDAGGVERVERGVDARLALVHGVVGGHRTPVEAGRSERRGDLRRHAVGRVAPVGWRAGRSDGCLQMAHGEIDGTDDRSDRPEHRREVVAPIAGIPAGHVDHRCVGKQIARDEDRERVVGGCRRRRRRCGCRCRYPVWSAVRSPRWAVGRCSWSGRPAALRWRWSS